MWGGRAGTDGTGGSSGVYVRMCVGGVRGWGGGG